MIKLIRGSIYSLIVGISILSIGALGSLSVFADSVKDASEGLYQSMGYSIFVGSALILISGVLFIIAVAKSK